MTSRCVVTATSTGVGKTFVARGLARSLSRAGRAVVAIKPLETGCDPDPLDALALEQAARTHGLSRDPGFYRARAPLSPFAATIGGEPPPPLIGELVRHIRALERGRGAELTLIEGAGGLFVPYDATSDLADLARILDAPLVIVAPDVLGVLSDVLAVTSAASARGLTVRAVVLSQHGPGDASRATNARILRERLGVDVRVAVMPKCPDDDDALADAVERATLGGDLFG